MKYEIDEKTKARLDKTFTYHTPKEDQPERYNRIRERALALAHTICGMTPPSREQSLALTKLEEAVMHTNAAIARNE